MHVRQIDRSARTRSALLESAARGLSRYGYGNLVLEQVASDAGYTRGALYHQFRDKEDLALAVLDWVDETWRQEVGPLIDREPDPARALIALAHTRRDNPVPVYFIGVGEGIDDLQAFSSKEFAEALFD